MPKSRPVLQIRSCDLFWQGPVGHLTYLDQYLFVLLVGWGILFEAVSGADIAKLDVAVESPAAVAVQAVSVLLESVVPANLNTWTI